MISFKRPEDKEIEDLYFDNLVEDLKQCPIHNDKPTEYLSDEFGVFCKICQVKRSPSYPDDYLKIFK